MQIRAWIMAGVGFIALTACGPKPAQQQRGPSADADQTSTITSAMGSGVRVAELLDPCANRANAFAQNLCGNRVLAGVDTQIRSALQNQATLVSTQGAQVLVQNQERWREATRIGCALLNDAARPNARQQQCLEGEFRSRLRDVRDAVQRVGGYTFQRVELLDAAPVTTALRASSGLGADAPPAILREIRYPRIDMPATPQAQRFNELVAQEPQYRLQDATNETVNYRIVYAGPDIVSVRFDLSADALGAAHPSDDSKAVTVLMRQGRQLEAADVFRAGSGWEDFLTQRAVAELTRQYRDYNFAPDASDVRQTVIKPHLWLVTEDALVLLFPPYSFGGPTALAGTEVNVPWAELRRYLNPSAPAPIRASA
ncbi:MAG TPA: hypothetical protein VG841_05365 [Caulobacterales bacterium]|nr:hypothetical protein [Caulobacterales bacterium]